MLYKRERGNPMVEDVLKSPMKIGEIGILFFFTLKEQFNVTKSRNNNYAIVR